jgi:LPXTG-motif cell wall-anchored protein
MVMACWHGFFTGNVGTLKTLVDYPYPSPTSDRVAVSIGGGEVSLPSSFTLSISPENPEAGQDLTVTATARTLDGVPQSGVTVTVTVSAGPDAGQTFTAVTDSSGVAIITIRTDSIGTAVYTATAVVNGVSKTVSTTVTWASPTAPPTTVPETAVPEPTVPQTAPPVVQIAEPVTETTVHDHSTHDHGPKIIKLPSTGIGFNFWLVSFGILFIAAGFFTRKLEKVNK